MDSEKIVKRRKIKVTHYKDKCIGCGACIANAPQNWEIDENGLAKLKGSICKRNFYIGEIDQQDYQDNKDAEFSCPMRIIEVSD